MALINVPASDVPQHVGFAELAQEIVFSVELLNAKRKQFRTTGFAQVVVCQTAEGLEIQCDDHDSTARRYVGRAREKMLLRSRERGAQLADIVVPAKQRQERYYFCR